MVQSPDEDHTIGKYKQLYIQNDDRKLLIQWIKVYQDISNLGMLLSNDNNNITI